MRHAALSLTLLAVAFAAGPALAKSTDRQQPMDLSASNMDALLSDDSVSVLEGNVRIRQGSLEVDADRAEIHRKAGEIDEIILTGSPARLRQLSDQGEPMDATAARIVYGTASEVMLLTGNVVITQPRGNLSGETVKYDITTGRLNGGGDGQTVSMRILPRTAAPAPAPAPTPAPAAEPGN
ncbi:MAG: lipopolysaccharide transport periplasmic protein LptA [Arenimonas sp.]|uniref:lipopolysaccharide transport periplasmic protein LptA n=1 Tax=Arenimonas sp. TaxID=1872635 RepID=UPI0025C0F385|nr:lipopolysaccharide transport periplasmic protein LptA [Arenimonas sp.]MBW8367022.1 lipopolysaccharide transport periplasmic protein LptA [Arenimonas sp.]